MGRPSKANDTSLKEAIRLALEGKTDAQIAKSLGVTKTTIQNWKKKHPQFFDLLKKSKKTADQKVETALFQRACGYSHPSEKIFLAKDGTVVRAPFIEHYPPDPTSMIFWLKNRDRERWRDKQEVEHELGLRAERLVGRLTNALARVVGDKDG